MYGVVFVLWKLIAYLNIYGVTIQYIAWGRFQSDHQYFRLYCLLW